MKGGGPARGKSGGLVGRQSEPERKRREREGEGEARRGKVPTLNARLLCATAERVVACAHTHSLEKERGMNLSGRASLARSNAQLKSKAAAITLQRCLR